MLNLAIPYNKMEISSTLIWLDQICDYLPFLSTATNLLELFEKNVFRLPYKCDLIDSNHYFSYINYKSNLRCVVLLVPFLGNIVVGLYDWVHHYQAERELQNFRARQLGLHVNQLSQTLAERWQIIENKQQKIAQDFKREMAKELDRKIAGMRQAVEKFKRVINNPEEQIELVLYGGVWTGTYQGTHQERMNYAWSQIKMGQLFEPNLPKKLARLEQDKTIKRKQREFYQLKKELIQLRQASYKNYIQTLTPGELLKEAQKYYLKSFFITERKKIKQSLRRITIATILPKLKARTLVQTKNDYAIVEMQEIILKMEEMA